MSYARKNPDVVCEQVKSRTAELMAIGAGEAVLVALGNDVHTLLKTHFPHRRIMKIPHYSAYITLNDYRKIVLEELNKVGA